jgi:predicted methyltransferase
LNYRLKLGLFFLCGISVLFFLDAAYQALDTFSQLKVVEADRDQWQRPSDIINALDLKPGNVVVDLGCGSGYFTVRLRSPVGARGRVVAEDIRWLPLIFLWARTLGQRNVSIAHGAPEDPHLPAEGADAVLIANTYHELQNPRVILARASGALLSGGRLVIADRGLPSSTPTSQETQAEEHVISPQQVENDIRGAGFQIVSRQDHFLEKDPFNQNWWLIVARKP